MILKETLIFGFSIKRPLKIPFEHNTKLYYNVYEFVQNLRESFQQVSSKRSIAFLLYVRPIGNNQAQLDFFLSGRDQQRLLGNKAY